MWNDQDWVMASPDEPKFSDDYWDHIDSNLDGSFPASDPPSWTLGRA